MPADCLRRHRQSPPCRASPSLVRYPSPHPPPSLSPRPQNSSTTFLNMECVELDLLHLRMTLSCWACAVASTTEDRDVMVNCLQLGAADYMMKPLRPTELRNLWARVYWWRRVSGRDLFSTTSSRCSTEGGCITVGLNRLHCSVCRDQGFVAILVESL